MGPVEEREERGLRKGKKFSDSWFVFPVCFFFSFCVWLRLPGWLVGLYVVVTENGSCHHRRGLVAAHGMVVRE